MDEWGEKGLTSLVLIGGRPSFWTSFGHRTDIIKKEQQEEKRKIMAYGKIQRNQPIVKSEDGTPEIQCREGIS